MTHEPAQADAIRRAADMLLSGGTVSGVMRDWTSRRLRNQTWTRNSVTTIMRNPRIAGLRAYKGEIVAKAEWEPIVPEETWRAVCALLDDPARKPPRGIRSLLGGLAVCQCGRTVQATGNATGRRVYRCNPSKRKGAGGDHCQQIREPIDAEVTERVIDALTTNDALIIGRADRPELAALRTKSRALRARRGQLAARLADPDVDLALTDAAVAKIDRDLALITAALAESVSESALLPFAALLDRPVGEMISAIDERRDIARQIWGELDNSRQRAVLRAVFAKIEILPAGRGSRTFDPATLITPPAASADLAL